jgi:hypothetical protein
MIAARGSAVVIPTVQRRLLPRAYAASAGAPGGVQIEQRTSLRRADDGRVDRAEHRAIGSRPLEAA